MRVSLVSIEQAAQAQRAGRSKARQVSSQKYSVRTQPFETVIDALMEGELSHFKELASLSGLPGPSHTRWLENLQKFVFPRLRAWNNEVPESLEGQMRRYGEKVLRPEEGRREGPLRRGCLLLPGANTHLDARCRGLRN